MSEPALGLVGTDADRRAVRARAIARHRTRNARTLRRARFSRSAR